MKDLPAKTFARAFIYILSRGQEVTPDEDIREVPLGKNAQGEECTIRLKVLPRRERIGSEIPLILFPSVCEWLTQAN